MRGAVKRSSATAMMKIVAKTDSIGESCSLLTGPLPGV